jgi:hypothetical protein
LRGSDRDSERKCRADCECESRSEGSLNRTRRMDLSQAKFIARVSAEGIMLRQFGRDLMSEGSIESSAHIDLCQLLQFLVRIPPQFDPFTLNVSCLRICLGAD